ncbi:hypothetical protein D8674_019039 [Pyrus ussuriensis x Pyrus communis]|uniref:Uncharacterized protein n=1 Tax=Pyrus ussuriensis x Pyrus communis TaxID=2448454 RepID=A0A5N5G744_9ROSA|nr:hypothetical protein D8674_019039 [Pyrus ussuriensis x Pyrus communis]
MCSVYENSPKFDHGGGSDGSYLDDRYGGYNRSRSDLGSDPYGKRYDVGPDAGMATVFMLTKVSRMADLLVVAVEDIEDLVVVEEKLKQKHLNYAAIMVVIPLNGPTTN